MTTPNFLGDWLLSHPGSHNQLAKELIDVMEMKNFTVVAFQWGSEGKSGESGKFGNLMPDCLDIPVMLSSYEFTGLKRTRAKFETGAGNSLTYLVNL